MVLGAGETMKKTEVKVLEHIRQILESIETYTTFSALSEVIEDRGVLRVLEKGNTEIGDKVSESVKWLDAVIADWEDPSTQ